MLNTILENVENDEEKPENNRNEGEEKISVQYFGAVEVTSQIAGDLFLNGKKIQYLTPGAVTVLKNLPAGYHIITIDGDEKWEQKLEITAGETTTVMAKSRKDLKLDNRWIFVEGDTWKMGSESGEPHERPVHRVKLSGFAIQQHEVTNAEFAAFLNQYGSDKVQTGTRQGEMMATEHRTGIKKAGNTWMAQPGFEQHPAINVTWFGADAYCRYIGGRLPTEGEWEFAARNGRYQQNTDQKFSGGNEATAVAWTYENANNTTNRVMTKNPNALDIYDMSGNVWEWCSDWYGESYYRECDKTGKIHDPAGPAYGIYKVIRGGSWSYKSSFSTSTYRNKTHPGAIYYDVGFRCVKSIEK